MGAAPLVATKLHVPQARPGTVARRALVDRLLAGRERKLALVCAPAGWGKTTLLAQWREDESRPFAWVSLDRSDDDPVRFWGYALGALRTVDADLGAAASAALPAAGAALADVVVAPLINDLAARSQPLVLVFDDYHLVHHQAIHESVAFLLRRLPATVQVAIAGRADPPLHVGRLRAAGEVVELRAGELRFSDAEADALLNGALGLDLEAGDVAALRARTEGWAAGLQLASLSLRAHADRHAFVEAFTGDDRRIGDYLHEVLLDQPPALREFLLRTSILDRLCAPLCDAVCGRDDAITCLDRADRANLFLVGLDGHGRWYRYHHLFRDLLRRELERSDPGLLPTLHRAASAWHRAHGEAGEAIAHATRAGDFVDACDLIAEHWIPVWNRGQHQTVATWIDALPRATARSDPRVCVARAWTALFLGAPGEMESWALAAESRPASRPLHFYDSVEAVVGLARATRDYFGGDIGRARAHARRALEQDTAPTRAATQLVLGSSHYLVGEHAAARELLEQARRTAQAPELADAFTAILGQLSLACFDGGDHAGARRYADEAEQHIAERRLDELHSVAFVRMAQAKLLEHGGDLEAARASLTRAVELARRGARRIELAHSLLLLARLERRRNDHAAGRAHAREARQVLATCPDPGMLQALLERTERSLQIGATGARSPAPDPELTERELAVLRLLASELSQREIGAELYVSFNTVKTHTRSIFRKLDAANRADAVARARELELI